MIWLLNGRVSTMKANELAYFFYRFLLNDDDNIVTVFK